MKAAEAAARTAKADRLAAYLIAEGKSADDVAKMGRRAQLAVARAAGTRPPGTDGQTWEAVIDTVRAHWHFTPPATPEHPEAHDNECQNCGGSLSDHQPVKVSRYVEASGGLCGRCVAETAAYV